MLIFELMRLPRGIPKYVVITQRGGKKQLLAQEQSGGHLTTALFFEFLPVCHMSL